MKPYSDITDPRLIKALAHPLRIRILGILEEREMASPNELSDLLGVSLGVMSYHVRRLHALGFLELVKRTPRRGAIEHHYRAKARPVVTDEGWAETPSIVKRAMVGASLEQVTGYVNKAASRGGFDRADAHLSRRSLTLDDRGWRLLASELEVLMQRVDRIETDSAERLGRSGSEHGEDAIAAAIVLMHFEATGVPENDAAAARNGEGHLGRRSSRRPRPLHAAATGAELD
ncbi:transcriptional regulator [Conexibacter sp. CPCC 206217]|uniref:ArsR/SmtB family transcription factor n=1 Tax=Conexibacter sp. CPCC 206217 TaxID=3064574 RepID=UPI00272346D2|nr:helix-turn-helix domain-containing protein [Conexibacter sp. CPCC 206217]MDO8212823.1 helix-turn-helix domain-containing protein [Conexibacter sp. CPCC 206217]